MRVPRTVHVVDDDAQMRESLRLTLESSGLDVVSYESAEEFMSKSSSSPTGADCLLLDIRMPGMGGLGLQQALRRNGSDVPIIFLSEHSEISIAVHVIQSGAVDYLQKPVHRAHLLERVGRALGVAESRRSEREVRLAFESRLAALSERERQFFKFLTAGWSTKEIAARLDVSIPTAVRHKSNVCKKMNARNVIELARQSFRYLERN